MERGFSKKMQVGYEKAGNFYGTEAPTRGVNFEKLAVLTNFAKFLARHLCWSFLFIWATASAVTSSSIYAYSYNYQQLLLKY